MAASLAWSRAWWPTRCVGLGLRGPPVRIAVAPAVRARGIGSRSTPMTKRAEGGAGPVTGSMSRSTHPSPTSSSFSSSSSSSSAPSSGQVVIYRGPPSVKPWIHFMIGGVFMLCGLELAHGVHDHFQWPLFSRDPNNPPKLLSQTKRRILAASVGAIGVVTGVLFWVSPTKSVVRLTLDLPARQLIVRTAAREFSALLPRDVYPAPLRRTAERRGWYQTPVLQERVVPLSSVYRIRGSAQAAGFTAAHKLRQPSGAGAASAQGDASGARRDARHIGSDERSSIEIKPGNDRWWYTLEASGGAEPIQRGYAGFWRRMSHSMRGNTDWSADARDAEQSDNKERLALQRAPSILTSQQQQQQQPSTATGPASPENEAERILGPKEPWFADRRTFDDVIPLIRRR